MSKNVIGLKCNGVSIFTFIIRKLFYDMLDEDLQQVTYYGPYIYINSLFTFTCHEINIKYKINIGR